MPRFLCTINLDDESANYTIGQMLSHLQLSIDQSDFDKVEKLLKRWGDKLKEEAQKEMEAVVAFKKDEISKEFLTEMEQMSKGLNEVEAKDEELVKWKVVLEESFDEVERKKGDLVEEVRMLREMNEDLKKREEAEKVRVLELELKVEVKRSLRVRAEEDFEALEKSFKELELRVVPTISSMEVDGCSRRSYVGTSNGNVIDLTEDAYGVLPENILTGNLMEGQELGQGKRVDPAGSKTARKSGRIKVSFGRYPSHTYELRR